jgi:hypothetical protein
MKSLILTILSILSLGLKAPQKETIFLGTVTTDTLNKHNIFGLWIEFRVDSETIARSLVQQDGTFKMTAKADKEFDIYYAGLGVGDTYLQTMKPTFKDTVLLNFKIPKNYKKLFGKAVCPKCHKLNQTIPIRYGEGSAIVFQHIDAKGDTILLPFNRKNYYTGTCITSDLDPKYYCKRDKIKF